MVKWPGDMRQALIEREDVVWGREGGCCLGKGNMRYVNPHLPSYKS